MDVMSETDLDALALEPVETEPADLRISGGGEGDLMPEVNLADLAATRDSTDIAGSGVPEGEAEVLHQPTATLEEAIEPGPVAFPESDGLPAVDPVTGPGMPEPRLPAQGEDGPSAGLATLAAWAGVLVGAVIVLDRVGVLSW